MYQCRFPFKNFYFTRQTNKIWPDSHVICTLALRLDYYLNSSSWTYSISIEKSSEEKSELLKTLVKTFKRANFCWRCPNWDKEPHGSILKIKFKYIRSIYKKKAWGYQKKTMYIFFNNNVSTPSNMVQNVPLFAKSKKNK